EQAQRRKAQQDADRVLNRYEGQGTGYEGQGVRFDVSDIETERDKLKKLQPVEVEVGKVSDRDRSDGIGAAVKAFEEVYGENGVKEKTVLGEVLIDGDSIKSSLGHLRYAAKYDVVLSLPEGIKKAAYMGNIPNGENGLPNHYFVYKIQYGAENKYVLCRVKNTDKGLKLYVHDVFDDEFVDKTIKKANSLQTLAPRKGDVTQGRVNPYKQIIFNFFGNVNDNNKGQSLSDAKSIEYFGVSLPGHSRDTDGAEVSQGNAPLRSSANNNITYKGVAVKDMTDLEKRQYREQVQKETIKQLKQELHNQKSATFHCITTMMSLLLTN
ncbi:MAG: hypothetical protein MJ032_02670, partial [Acidaminococcaceae bacterium]|nr:hypothetical protein [Acidaminococcaceae bacterium]